MAKSHLVILKKPYLEAILSGRKTIESRFTKTKCPPFGQIEAGDRLFLKLSSGPVCGRAAVAKVKSFADLTPTKIFELKKRFNHAICGSDQIWQNKLDCRYGLLIWLKGVGSVEPRRIDKKDWRAWVVLTAQEHFGLLKAGQPR